MTSLQAFGAGFLVAGALGVGWGILQDSKAALRQLQHEEALATGAKALDATRAELNAAAARSARLAIDSSRMIVSLRGARAARDAAQAENRTLATRLRAAGDTGGAAVVDRGDSAAAAERTACSLVILNCEQRATNAVAAWQRAAAQLDATAAQLDTTVTLWRDAERRANPGIFTAFWRARTTTLPLLAAVAYLALRR
jgi:hypothetical protein